MAKEKKLNAEEIKNSERNEQERMIQVSLLEQEAKQVEQQISLLEQQIIELQLLSLHLDEIEKTEINSEILSSLGRNIFIKSQLLSKEILVDVGAKTIVKKTIPETKDIIDKDIKQLIEVRNNLTVEFQKIIRELSGLVR